MPKRVLHCVCFIQIVEHHFRHFAAAQLDHDAHAVLVGFVAKLGNAFELLLLTNSRDLFEQLALFTW